MSEVQYNSSIGEYMTLFLNERRSLGHKALDVKFTLLTIDHYLESIKYRKSYIDKDTYLAWLETQQQYKPATRYQHISIFRRLLKYMCNLGVECYVPIQPRQHNKNFTPYIFSKEEIERIFIAVDSLQIVSHHSNSIMIAVPAILRTLYSTGMRISEALAIKNKDIDFVKHIIVLHETKNGSQRIAPINDSLEMVLKQYVSYRNQIPISNLDSPDSFFFVSSLGKNMARNTVRNYFQRIITTAGIAYKGGHEGPRLHDLRHTACVHSLINQVRQGRDIYCSLPMLSVFMGHKKVSDTEHYLRLTADMYPDIVKLDMSVTANISSVLREAINKNGHENI